MKATYLAQHTIHQSLLWVPLGIGKKFDIFASATEPDKWLYEPYLMDVAGLE